MSDKSADESLAANAKALGDVCVYPWNEQGIPGITLRQWYAGLAMQGFATQTLDDGADNAYSPSGAAHDAVLWADALLKELAK